MTLVTLGMMTQMSHTDLLDSPKYKCLVSLDFIKGIARCVANWVFTSSRVQPSVSLIGSILISAEAQCQSQASVVICLQDREVF